MLPEEVVQAAQDLRAEVILPVHWGKFILSTHPWNEPVTRLTAAARQQGIQYVVPMIGETYRLGEPYVQKEWWQM